MHSTSFDFIVVGAGSSGAVLASRLSECRDCRVLLIEAGPDGGRTATPRAVKTVEVPATVRCGDVARAVSVRRGRTIGGTGAINGAMFLRGLPEDFDLWQSLGNKDWGFAAVLNTFRALERDLDIQDAYHGSDGPVTVQRCQDWQIHPSLRAFREACLASDFPADPDANNPWTSGISYTPFNLRRVGERVPHDDAATFYLTPSIRLRQNLEIWSDTSVRRVLFQGTTARGVEIARNRTVSQVLGKRVVIAAGAIGSPQLLQVSGVGDARNLKAIGIQPVIDLPGVGARLDDHPAFEVQWTENVPTSDAGLRNGVFALRFSSHSRNDIKVVMRLRQARYSMRCSLNRAQCDGGVHVASPEAAHPEVWLSYMEGESDWLRAELALKTCLQLARQRALRPLLGVLLSPAPDDLKSPAATRQWLMRNISTNNHLTGGCRMGDAAAALSVVDSAGAVHGAVGLSVVDASIMPSCVSANINATVMMIAERISSVLAGGDLASHPDHTKLQRGQDAAVELRG